MFNYREEDLNYFVGGDEIKGEFGPFKGVFVKNKYLGEIKKDLVDEKKYTGYKYSIGITEKRLFVIGLEGIEEVILITR